MIRCPHCHQPGIGALKKLLSSEAMPAKCSACEKFSALTSFAARMLAKITFPALFIVGFFAYGSGSFALFIAGAIVVFAAWATVFGILVRISGHTFM